MNTLMFCGQTFVIPTSAETLVVKDFPDRWVIQFIDGNGAFGDVGEVEKV